MAELGILLRTYLPIQQSIELVQEAERRGFHSVWVTESMDSKDAFTQMAAWAMKTERIHVGSGITPIYTRTPVMSGMTMLSLAELSGERAILGLGTGHPFGVEEGHGVKLDRPLASIREYTEIVRLVTQKREFSYHGEVFNIPGYAGYERSHFETHPFRIPIFLAALRSGMVRLAGELADGVLMNLATPEYIRRAADIFRQEAQSAGRDLGQMTFASIVNASVSQDEGAAAETVRRSVAMYPTLMPFYRRMLRETGFADEMRAIAPEVATGDVEAATRKIPDSMLRSLGVFGSAQQAREGLKVFEETEADLLVLHPFVAEGADTGQAIADVIQAFGR
jgi:alkanesulfonate monooxygenase SsuD/methylene tetrahydromethanopterin reductase-like flavin-dependent oxidoreductase (luciferase family)